jgi:hypothetical protein
MAGLVIALLTVAWVVKDSSPLLRRLRYRELPAALVICLAGRQRRRALCGILDRRARLSRPLPAPVRRGPPSALAFTGSPSPRADAGAYAELAGFMRGGMISADEARARVAGFTAGFTAWSDPRPWPSPPGRRAGEPR